MEDDALNISNKLNFFKHTIDGHYKKDIFLVNVNVITTMHVENKFSHECAWPIKVEVIFKVT